MSFNVAIDGRQCRKKYHCKSCGKEKKDLSMWNTGAMYRAMALFNVKRGRRTHGCSGHRR